MNERTPQEELARRRIKYPIDSFAPELLQALLKGARETVTLHFATDREARYFQARLHLLRARLREDGHEEAALIAKARTRREAVGRMTQPSVVTISPFDAEFAGVLSRAGVTAKPLESDPLAELVREEPKLHGRREGSAIVFGAREDENGG